MSSQDSVAQYMVSASYGTFMRQGVVESYRNGPPPVCDVNINCEGLFRDIAIATPRAPYVGETVWLMEQSGRFVVMGIQQNSVPIPASGGTVYDQTSGGGQMQGPLITNSDIRNSVLRYCTAIGGTFDNVTLNSPTINNAAVVGGSVGGIPVGNLVSGIGATITRPVLQQPVIDSPSFDGGAEVIASGAIRSANYTAGFSGWAIGGNGAAEFNDILVRNSGMIGGVALGLTDISGQVDGGSIASADFLSGVRGWAIDGNGYAEFNSGYFRGSIAAGGTIDIGGSDTSSFHVDALGNMWLGAATYAAAPFKVSAAGDVDARSVSIQGKLITTATGARVDVGNVNPSAISIYHAGTQVAPAALKGWYSASAPQAGGLEIRGPRMNSSFDAPWISIYQEVGAGKGFIGINSLSVLLIESGLRVLDGDVNLPAISFHPDNGTGIYRDSTGNVSFASQGVRAATINAIRLDVGSAGISYTGTNGTGTPNVVGFKWSSPNLYGRIDSSVECIVGTVSDRRLKDEIWSLNPENALDMLENLQVYTYLPKPLNEEPVRHERRPGLMADEVQSLLPWAVPLTASPDDYQTVDYLGMVPLLIGAVQSLSQRVEELENGMN